LRARFRPVAVKEVKVDIGAGGLKLCRVDREQDNLCVAIAQGDKEEAIQNGTSCDDEKTESQECLDPITFGYYNMRHSDTYHRSVAMKTLNTPDSGRSGEPVAPFVPRWGTGW
jgi:hypothetical protein